MITREYFLNLIENNFIIENEYFYKYIELINNNLYNLKIKSRTQRHHIIPRSYYKLNNIEINNSSSNLVNLLHKDHIMAHYYLALCTTGNFKYSNENCLYRILGNSEYLKSPSYDKEKELILKLEKWQYLQEDLYKERSKKYKGRKHSPNSEIQKKQISAKNKGNMYVKKLINNRWIAKRVKDEEELNQYLSDGWLLGNLTRKENPNVGKNVSEAKKGKICITNNIVNKYIDKTELDSYLEKGWIRGVHKYKRREDRILIIKFGKTKSINKNKLSIYLEKGWQIYDNRQE